MSPVVEFDCVDCRQHIMVLGVSEIPADRRCGVCRYLLEFVPDEEEREAMRRQLQKHSP